MATYDEIEVVAQSVEEQLSQRFNPLTVGIIPPNENAWGLNETAMKLIGQLPDRSPEWRLEIAHKNSYIWVEVTRDGDVVEFNLDDVAEKLWRGHSHRMNYTGVYVIKRDDNP